MAGPNTQPELSTMAMGRRGAFFISDTDAHTGSWFAITFIEDTIFNVLTASNWTGDTYTGETFPKGITIYGIFTAIDLTGGACIAYEDGAAVSA